MKIFHSIIILVLVFLTPMIFFNSCSNSRSKVFSSFYSRIEQETQVQMSFISSVNIKQIRNSRYYKALQHVFSIESKTYTKEIQQKCAKQLEQLTVIGFHNLSVFYVLLNGDFESNYPKKCLLVPRVFGKLYGNSIWGSKPLGYWWKQSRYKYAGVVILPNVYSSPFYRKQAEKLYKSISRSKGVLHMGNLQSKHEGIRFYFRKIPIEVKQPKVEKYSDVWGEMTFSDRLSFSITVKPNGQPERRINSNDNKQLQTLLNVAAPQLLLSVAKGYDLPLSSRNWITNKVKSYSGVGTRLKEIGDNAIKWFDAEHPDKNGNPLPKHFPCKNSPHYTCNKQFSITTPKEMPCSSGSKLYKPDESIWKIEPWRTLGFSIDKDHKYQYTYSTSGVGTASRFTIKAIGDLDCDKIYSTFKVIGTVNVVTGEVERTNVIISNALE